MKLASFKGWRSVAAQALTRFPLNILSASVGAVCGIVALHTEKNDWLVGQCVRLAMTAALGLPLFFSLRMLRERSSRPARWPLELLGVPLLTGWWFLQPARPDDAPGIFMIRWLLLLAALHFFAAVSAYVWSRERLGFWQFNRRLFLRFCLATLYTAVLTAGLELALLSADKLFGLKLGKAYADLWFIMTGLFHPVFFLAGIPRDFSDLENDEAYPRGLKAFNQFALAPLVAVYTAILYTYAVKIVVARTWPHGWVALPVLLLSGIGILSFLLLYPLRGRVEEKWARWFTVNFPRALAPLSLLLLLSVRVRIRTYGVTEERYLGIVLGLWILSWSLVFVVRRNSGIRWVPASLAIICLLAAFGPWSAGAISRTSQLSRLERMLQVHGLWKDGHAVIPGQDVKLSTADQTDFRATLTYLVRTHGGTSVAAILQPVLVAKRDWNKERGWDIAREVMNSLRIGGADDEDYGRVVHRKPATSLDLQGFRRMWRVASYSGHRSDWSPTKLDGASVGLEQGILKIQLDGEPQRQEVPLDGLYSHLDAAEDHQLPDEQMFADFTRASRSFRLVFETLTFRRENGAVRLSSCEFYLLEK